MQVPKTMQDIIDDYTKATKELAKYRADFLAASIKAENALQILCNSLLLVGPFISSEGFCYSVKAENGQHVLTATRIDIACEQKPENSDKEKVPA